mmetsp:Transcript_49849/g.117437  ORF Transcript_49849/g.117437 Transcript_49849/m.117437 type:complete len:80 (-) Transcript_49849:430-669(-)
MECRIPAKYRSFAEAKRSAFWTNQVKTALGGLACTVALLSISKGETPSNAEWLRMGGTCAASLLLMTGGLKLGYPERKD